MSPSPNPPPPWMKETNYYLDLWELISKKGLKEKMLLSRRDCCVPALAFQFKGSIVRDYKLSGTIIKAITTISSSLRGNRAIQEKDSLTFSVTALI